MAIVRISHIQFRVSSLPTIGSELPSFFDTYFEHVSNIEICWLLLFCLLAKEKEINSKLLGCRELTLEHFI